MNFGRARKGQIVRYSDRPYPPRVFVWLILNLILLIYFAVLGSSTAEGLDIILLPGQYFSPEGNWLQEVNHLLVQAWHSTAPSLA